MYVFIKKHIANVFLTNALGGGVARNIRGEGHVFRRIFGPGWRHHITGLHLHVCFLAYFRLGKVNL